MHCFGGLGWSEGDERDPGHEPDYGNHYLFVDLYRRGGHQHRGYGDGHGGTRGDGYADRESDVGCERQCVHVDLEFDECDVLHRLRWLERSENDERQPKYLCAYRDHVLFVDLHGRRWREQRGDNNRHGPWHPDGHVDRESDIDSERGHLHIDLEFDECHLMYRLRWVGRNEGDKRLSEHEPSYGHHVVFVNLYR